MNCTEKVAKSEPHTQPPLHSCVDPSDPRHVNMHVYMFTTCMANTMARPTSSSAIPTQNCAANIPSQAMGSPFSNSHFYWFPEPPLSRYGYSANPQRGRALRQGLRCAVVDMAPTPMLSLHVRGGNIFAASWVCKAGPGSPSHMTQNSQQIKGGPYLPGSCPTSRIWRSLSEDLMDIEAAMTAFSCWGWDRGGKLSWGGVGASPQEAQALSNALLEPRLGGASCSSPTQAAPTLPCLPRPHRHEQLDSIREVAQERECGHALWQARDSAEAQHEAVLL